MAELTENDLLYLRSLSESEQEDFLLDLTPEQLNDFIADVQQTDAGHRILAPATSKQNEYEKRQQAIRADIGELPPIRDQSRRDYCANDLHEFLKVYFPQTTGRKPFSDDQKTAIQRMQQAIVSGGSRVLNLFPRGFAKTTISENAAIWACLYGHRKHVPIIGANHESSIENMKSIKKELSENDLLIDDFPEVCYPMVKADGLAQRAQSLTYHGEPAHLIWQRTTIVFPSLRDESGRWYNNAGGYITTRGLTGQLRGMGHKRADGTKQRPDFVIIDDPQTDASAKSPVQCDKRLGLIRGTVLRLGGHEVLMSAVMNATCIIEDDVVDQLADHVSHPEWEGLRIPMVKKFPDTHETLWMTDYAEIRKSYNPEDPKDRMRAVAASTEYYREHRQSMDAGGVATWNECFAEGELSALQHAYNILIDDGERGFASECQNQPMRMGQGSGFLSAGDINRDRVGTWKLFPNDVETIGFHIDVQKRMLYWTVVGISKDFRIYPHYGCYPKQKTMNFEYRSAKLSIQQVHRGLSEEKSIQKALEVLLGELTATQWERQDGVKLPFDCGLVDGGYQVGSVREAIKAVGCATRVFVLFGRGVKAGDVPMMQRTKRKGELRSADNAIPWTMQPDATVKGFRNVFDDTNSLKTFLHRRIATDAGRSGSFELPKGEHRRYCEHLASSEYATETTGPHGTLLEWKTLPGSPDNHWLDTTCGAIVACSVAGKVRFNQSSPIAAESKKKRVSYL